MSNQMSHRIILLNFPAKAEELLSKAGFNVERGYLGAYEAKDRLPFQTPHPLYEYDVLIYDSNYGTDLLKEFSSPINLFDQKGSYEALASFDGPPFVRVAFIGGTNGAKRLFHAGLKFVNLFEAEKSVSSFVEAKTVQTFAIPELHDVLVNFQGQIRNVRQFYLEDQDHYPFYCFPVLCSRSGQRVMGYGTTYDSAIIPRYVILPELRDHTQAVIKLLHCIDIVCPSLFPDRNKRNWLNADEFLLPEERTIQKEIRETIDQATKVIEAKRAAQEKIASENAFVKRLLFATEDSKQEPGDRLSGVVKKALEYLEFVVEDIDQKTKSAIKKEDFWVSEQDFLAITEVTGTANKNPKTKEWNDILARMTTLSNRRTDLELPLDKIIRGLLVLNYDIDNHPAKRPRVYTGEDEYIVETAVEQGIGLLSTVELHKIIVAIKEGRLTKGEARKIIRKPGRIEFDTTKIKPATDNAKAEAD